jgi:hypothetical protein
MKRKIIKWAIKGVLYIIVLVGLDISGFNMDIGRWEFWAAWISIGIACMGFEAIGESSNKEERIW